jgi:hypothetical protein
MIDPGVALFAIEASVRLGRKLQQTLVDETAERPLLMPLGDLFGSVTEAEAMRFYTVEQPELIEPGGVCHAFRDDRLRLIEFYRALRGVESHAAMAGDPRAQRRRLAGQLSALDQFDRAFESLHPARRILGTVVEIGMDYFAAHPEAMGRESTARGIVGAFVAGLTDTEFAEGTGREVLGNLLSAALRSLESHAELVEDHPRLTGMLGGVSGAVAEELRLAVAEESMLSRQQLLRRIGASLIRGVASAFDKDLLLVPSNHGVRGMIQSVMGQVLGAIRDHGDLFAAETVEAIVQSALRTAAENPSLLTGGRQLERLIGEAVVVLADGTWDRLFAKTTAGAVLVKALDVTREYRHTLVSRRSPGTVLPARALAALVEGLSARQAGPGGLERLLSSGQVVELAGVVVRESARDPEHLLGTGTGDRTVLARVIASVARALGNEPERFTDGDGFIRLVQLALGVTVDNAALVDVDSASPTGNRLYRILRQIVAALARAKISGASINPGTFKEIVERVLPLASANYGALGAKAGIVGAGLDAALALSRTSLAGRVNGGNLGVLVEHLLNLALWDELDLEDLEAMELEARTVLRSYSTPRWRGAGSAVP